VPEPRLNPTSRMTMARTTFLRMTNMRSSEKLRIACRCPTETPRVVSGSPSLRLAWGAFPPKSDADYKGLKLAAVNQ